jgi:hypothetical protein
MAGIELPDTLGKAIKPEQLQKNIADKQTASTSVEEKEG